MDSNDWLMLFELMDKFMRTPDRLSDKERLVWAEAKKLNALLQLRDFLYVTTRQETYFKPPTN